MACAGLVSYLAAHFFGADRGLFLPGPTANGHYQIEMRCDACHRPFAGAPDDRCLSCHADELQAKNDSHSPAKFADPRNAATLAAFDARRCVTCHREHRPQQTAADGSTAPADFCIRCHRRVGEERPTHARFSPTGCAAFGCHHYHDNTALYEDFLRKHSGESNILVTALVPSRNFAEQFRARQAPPPNPLRASQKDAPPGLPATAKLLQDWEQSSHARAGINCSGCHLVAARDHGKKWTTHPDSAGCLPCHEIQVQSFGRGRHGMRLAQALPPMSPASARLVMKPQAHERLLTCASCHAAHSFDTARAAVEACLECHQDQHSLRYRRSPHFRLWSAEFCGKSPKGSGVSCATCHLPRLRRADSSDAVFVSHNQSGNLRPTERMAREVCLNCHGLSFALASLADPHLIQNNFAGSPGGRLPAFEMVARRDRRQQQPAAKP